MKDGEKYEFQEPNPFASEGEEVASVAYRYRRWRLDTDIFLVARCELHSYLRNKGGDSFMEIYALNEFDPKLTGMYKFL